MRLKFWGVRGSIPVPGIQTSKYGGNTPCIEIQKNEDETFIFDAGTGIFQLGNKLVYENKRKKIHIFLTHFHWDHIQGFPFFAPFFHPDFEVKIYYNRTKDMTAPDFIDQQMRPGFFPVRRKDVFHANVQFVDITDIDSLTVSELQIDKIKTHHSEGTYSYKITEDGKSIVFMTDNEIYCHKEEKHPEVESICDLNKDLIEFSKDVDILIHDSQYLEESFSYKVGWGHSNNAAVVYFAHTAKVKTLFLFHYDPEFSDEKVELMHQDSVSIGENELSTPVEILLSQEGREIIL